MKRLLAVTLLLTVSTVLHAADSGRLLAFVVDNRLTLAIGKFEPGHGPSLPMLRSRRWPSTRRSAFGRSCGRWVQSTDFYAPPQSDDVFTLYTPAGKVAAVTIQEKRSPYRDGTFAAWSAEVSAWDNRSTPYALAVAGSAPLSDGRLEPIALDNPESRAIVSKYLKSRGLHVDQPFLTQAFTVPLEDHGRSEVVLVAHSDASAVSTEHEASVYAVALLRRNDHGKEKVLPLASQTSFKPAGRTREEHEHLYGTQDFLRLVAAVDLDGDGWKEIVLYDAKDDATQIDVFTFNGRRMRRVLSAYKPNYN
jgi:hypothetical protein